VSIELRKLMHDNNYVGDLITLLDQSELARNRNDWHSLEKISIQIFHLISKEGLPSENSLKKVVVNYLGSIVGTGAFLTDLEKGNLEAYEKGVSRLLEFLGNKPHKFKSVDLVVNAATEITLLSLDPTPANRNKISRNLREIARPDISIMICKQILEKTRLNYYSLTVMCGAYCDLGDFDSAINSAEIALKFQLDVGKSFSLNALVRAHTLKFKATGDFSEIDKALSYAHKSIDLKLDIYAANAFIAAAISSMYEKEIENAKEVLLIVKPHIKTPDINALFQAYKSAQSHLPDIDGVEIFDEFDEENASGA